MIQVNGRELDLHGLHAKSEARKRAGLYDDRWLGLLEKELAVESGEHAFPMLSIVYDLQRSLEESGWKLEPPPDLRVEPGQKVKRRQAFLRRIQTRFIGAVNEGYVQQQEKFNTCFTRGMGLSYRLLYRDNQDGPWEGTESRHLCLASRPGWGEEAVEAVCGQGSGAVVMIGIPGISLLEKLRDGGRPLLVVETCDRAVAESQARYLPAFYHPRPLEFLEGFAPAEVGLLLLAFPEGLEGQEIRDLMGWAGRRLAAGGVVLLALNRKAPHGLSPDAGLVRFWPHRFLARAMREAGMEVSPWQVGEMRFLKGERRA